MCNGNGQKHSLYSLKCVYFSVVNFTLTFECLKLLFCYMDQLVTIWSLSESRRNDDLGSQNWKKIVSRRSTVDMKAHCSLHAVIKHDITDVPIMSKKMSNRKLNALPKLMMFPPTKKYFQEHVKRSHLQVAT